MFEVLVTKNFEATHALRNHHGADEAMHAHTWRVDVTIASPTLCGDGCAIDFAEVEGALARAIAPLAGRSLNECPVFASASPSAENLARMIYGALSASLDDRTRHVARVTAWEDEAHAATYFE